MLDTLKLFFYKLTYYFTSPINIHIDNEDCADYNLYGPRLANMIEVTQYFIWRKFSLILGIPFLLTTIVLNIVNYFNIKKNIEYYQNQNYTHLNNQELYEENNFNNIRNRTEQFIELLNSGKTLDYILFYNIFSSVCMFIELLFLILIIKKQKVWYTSKKIMFIYAWFSYFWIYFIYLNPVINYFKLEYNHNNSITQQNYLYSYSFTYVLYKLLKEIIPLSLCFFSAFLWSVVNVKCLFPNSIYVGYLYNYSTYVFFMTSGTILLVINQLMSNIMFSLSIGSFILGIYITSYCYGKRLKYFYTDNKNLKEYNFRLNLMKNIFLSISLLLCLAFLMLYDNPFNHGIYKFYKTDIFYFICKIIYKIIFYKVWCCDILISWILNTEKYRDVYKIELQAFNDKMKYIERQLYEDKYTILN